MSANIKVDIFCWFMEMRHEYPDWKPKTFIVSKLIRLSKYKRLTPIEAFESPHFACGFATAVIESDFRSSESDRVIYRIELRGPDGDKHWRRSKHFDRTLEDVSPPMKEKLIESRDLYDIKMVWDPSQGNSEECGMLAAMNKSGDYIGEPRDAVRLCDEMGIDPELRDPNHSVCSIGFSAKYKRWYGWSHRSMAGFAVGDKAYEPPEGTPEIIQNIYEAKLSSERFAESVS